MINQFGRKSFCSSLIIISRSSGVNLLCLPKFCSQNNLLLQLPVFTAFFGSRATTETAANTLDSLPDSTEQVENRLPGKQKAASTAFRSGYLKRDKVFTCFPVAREFSFKSVYIPGCHSPKIRSIKYRVTERNQWPFFISL